MSRLWPLPLAEVARACLLAAAAGLLIESAHMGWLVYEQVEAFHASHQATRSLPPRTRKAPEQLVREQAGPVDKRMMAPGSAAQAPSPTPQLRSLLVEFGPARSEVYVNGVHLGQTPYAGQLSCVDGDRIQVQVVPTRGVPLERFLRCGGSTLLAGPTPKQP